VRKINKIIIHCSATPPDMNIGVKEIDRWHKERGWKGIGYHYVIRRDGTIEYGRPVGDIGAHTRGQNRNSIGICWVGANGADNRTYDQKQAMIILIKSIVVVCGNLDIFGHKDFANTQCPGFDARKEYRNL